MLQFSHRQQPIYCQSFIKYFFMLKVSSVILNIVTWISFLLILNLLLLSPMWAKLPLSIYYEEPIKFYLMILASIVVFVLFFNKMQLGIFSSITLTIAFVYTYSITWMFLSLISGSGPDLSQTKQTSSPIVEVGENSVSKLQAIELVYNLPEVRMHLDKFTKNENSLDLYKILGSSDSVPAYIPAMPNGKPSVFLNGERENFYRVTVFLTSNGSMEDLTSFTSYLVDKNTGLIVPEDL